jgi:hypothetical protein
LLTDRRTIRCFYVRPVEESTCTFYLIFHSISGFTHSYNIIFYYHMWSIEIVNQKALQFYFSYIFCKHFWALISIIWLKKLREIIIVEKFILFFPIFMVNGRLNIKKLFAELKMKMLVRYHHFFMDWSKQCNDFLSVSITVSSDVNVIEILICTGWEKIQISNQTTSSFVKTGKIHNPLKWLHRQVLRSLLRDYGV